MTDSFVDRAEESMGALERVFKGLPLVREYNDKELRREADHRLRQLLASELEQEKQRLYDLQKQLLRGGGLAWMDDADGAIQRLQTLIDRIKTASYGYAGLFAAVKVEAEQLDTLHRFDVALAERAQEINERISQMEASAANRDALGPAIQAVNGTVTELQRLFDKRSHAIVDPAHFAGAPLPASESVDDDE
ncbi:MAG: hypothetical protein OXO48_04815 [Caldilineaceae bacterium]|nr:hypothetical protein [Caldilineaceae bacterium]MDE0069011.1 hypothetical protein [Caldilineaceae bacterium]MDE0428871.1 hypothetical protein [Caldilineaceae bacterium]